MRDFAEIMGIEFIHINSNTTIPELRDKLALGDIVWGR
jgi:L-arabinose isomerase